MEVQHAARRQIEVDREAEAEGRAHRRGQQASRRPGTGSGTTGLGHSKQDGSRRREAGRVGIRQAEEHGAGSQGRQNRGTSFGISAESGPVGVGKEGGGYPEEKCGSKLALG